MPFDVLRLQSALAVAQFLVRVFPCVRVISTHGGLRSSTVEFCVFWPFSGLSLQWLRRSLSNRVQPKCGENIGHLNTIRGPRQFRRASHPLFRPVNLFRVAFINAGCHGLST